MTTSRTAHRICPFCEACCGLTLRIEDDKVVGVRGHDEDVFSRGYICPKGVAIKDLHDDPDRLRSPLIKRNGSFVEATWDEAFAEIERRLQPLLSAGDRDAFAVTLGNPAAHKIGILLYGGRLAKALGTRNVFSASTLDQMPKQLSSGLMFGHWLSVPLPDIERTNLMVVLGANPLASNGSMWTVPDFRGKAKALKERGGRLVVIDPRRTETAALADQHHFIRPGADVFLLLGMVQALFSEQRVRLGAISEHVAGLAELEAAVIEFSPESVAARCGIPAGTIRQLARDLANTPRAVLYARIGTCTQVFGTLSSWLVDVVNALTGHLDVEGGALFAKSATFAQNTQGKPGIGRGIVTGRHHARVSGAPEVYGELPISALSEEIEAEGKGQVRALFTIASNPVLSAPNGPRLSEALETLEFMVSVDIYLNETTRHADVILPGRSPLEDAHFDVAFPQLSYRNQARYSPPVFAPTPGQPAEWEILLRLAAIARGESANADIDALDDATFSADLERQLAPLGNEAIAIVKSALAGRRGPDRLIDFSLRTGPYGDLFGQRPGGLSLNQLERTPNGVDLGPLAPRIPEMLRTPSGKVELAPPLLLADLPRVSAALREPAPELVIIGRREVRSNNSWMHNLPLLAKGQGKYESRCTLLLNPRDAQRHSIADGDMVRITSATGEIIAQAELSDEVMPGVTSLPHGWGHDQPGTRTNLASKRPGANLNALFDPDARDPLSGNSVLSGVAVTLARAP
ncbi:MAG: molybdopterin-dependent oxidoreductase [Rhodocyclaceae bacterium]|nr:molybdopterin-dependent oxidoreductase [Rhodocyclaceae bacterium]